MTDEETARTDADRRPDHASDAKDTDTVSGVDVAATVDEDDTVGTGSAIALGCIAGTLLLIVIGLILVAVFALAR